VYFRAGPNYHFDGRQNEEIPAFYAAQRAAFMQPGSAGAFIWSLKNAVENDVWSFEGSLRNGWLARPAGGSRLSHAGCHVIAAARGWPLLACSRVLGTRLQEFSPCSRKSLVSSSCRFGSCQPCSRSSRRRGDGDARSSSSIERRPANTSSSSRASSTAGGREERRSPDAGGEPWELACASHALHMALL